MKLEYTLPWHFYKKRDNNIISFSSNNWNWLQLQWPRQDYLMTWETIDLLLTEAAHPLLHLENWTGTSPWLSPRRTQYWYQQGFSTIQLLTDTTQNHISITRAQTTVQAACNITQLVTNATQNSVTLQAKAHCVSPHRVVPQWVWIPHCTTESVDAVAWRADPILISAGCSPLFLVTF